MPTKQSTAILCLNGPNLNMLGKREPEIYGSQSLADIETATQDLSKQLKVKVEFRQSNHEGELVDWIQGAGGQFAALIVNAGALTHTSVALLDALRLFSGPVVEIHLSNIFRREPFRHRSFISEAADGVICGFGKDSYLLGLRAAVELIKRVK
ncbi:MAG TPA: type II 3-dehydroquinate dehydratase [Alphaproteobacteria bacterium]|nr:type II 3-dehydroquinate dehydratase [Alphaproteobacteria bacterium]